MFFELYPIREQIELYGITGGVPGYFEAFDKVKSFQENLKELFFTDSGAFFKTPEWFQTYVEQPRIAYSILLALKNKHCKLHEISEQTSFTPSVVSTVLGDLEELGVIEKLIPVTEEEGSRRARYRIQDGVLSR